MSLVFFAGGVRRPASLSTSSMSLFRAWTSMAFVECRGILLSFTPAPRYMEARAWTMSLGIFRASATSWAEPAFCHVRTNVTASTL